MALTQTTEEYASRSSIHEIDYAFDRDLNSVVDDEDGENNDDEDDDDDDDGYDDDPQDQLCFDRDLNIVDRLLWLLVVLAFLGIAAYLSWDLGSQWKNKLSLDCRDSLLVLSPALQELLVHPRDDLLHNCSIDNHSMFNVLCHSLWSDIFSRLFLWSIIGF